jgi:hypothetical protein
MLEKHHGVCTQLEGRMIYIDMFECWEDVQQDFRMSEPEPDEVLAAVYESGGYEGSAEVIYRRGEKYYVASGSHCSCRGLEGQWEPEEYDKATMKAVLEKAAGMRLWSKEENAYSIALKNWKD